jgi:hypothetical protein
VTGDRSSWLVRRARLDEPYMTVMAMRLEADDSR